MQIEFESKILDIDVDDIIKKLNTLGAKKIFDRLQKRYVYDFHPPREGSWVRLRSDGEQTTLTIKEINTDKIDGTKELEIVVDDFEKTHLLLQKLGYVAKGYQENKRIRYILESVEVDIDFWPKIPPYIEIEAKSTAEVENIIRKLGFDPSQATSMNTIKVYKKYGLDLNSIPELKF